MKLKLNTIVRDLAGVDIYEQDDPGQIIMAMLREGESPEAIINMAANNFPLHKPQHLTVGQLLINALLDPPDSQITEEAKLSRFKLAQEISHFLIKARKSKKSELDLTIDQVSTCLDAAGRLPPLALGRVYEVLDPSRLK